MTGGLGGRRGGRVERGERVRPVNWRRSRNSRTLEAEPVREPAEAEQRTHVAHRQRGGRAEAERVGDQGEFRAGQVGQAAHSVGWCPNRVWLLSARKFAVSVVRERGSVPSGCVSAG